MSDRPSTNGGNGSTTGGRTPGGRFAKGNAGGPGNPHARRVARLRCVQLDKLDAGGLERVADKLIAKAEQGDPAAIRLALAYGIGKPTDAPDPDRLDLHERALERERQNRGRERQTG